MRPAEARASTEPATAETVPPTTTGDLNTRAHELRPFAPAVRSALERLEEALATFGFHREEDLARWERVRSLGDEKAAEFRRRHGSGEGGRVGSAGHP